MALRGTPASICFPMSLLHGAHCQEHLRISAPASSIFPMALRHGAPASHKPHSAEKSTPVWLALWRIWAGFANSQLRCAAFLSPYLYICAYPRYCHLGTAAQTDANLSAHLHRLPTPPPYLRRMRLSPGWGRRYRELDEAIASQGCRRWMTNAAAGCSLLVVRGAVPANHRARFKNANVT